MADKGIHVLRLFKAAAFKQLPVKGRIVRHHKHGRRIESVDQQAALGYSKETNFVVEDGEIEYNSSSSSPEEEEYDFSVDDSDCDSFHSVGDKDDKEEIQKDEFVPSEEEDEDEDADSELSEEEIEKEN